MSQDVRIDTVKFMLLALAAPPEIDNILFSTTSLSTKDRNKRRHKVDGNARTTIPCYIRGKKLSTGI